MGDAAANEGKSMRLMQAMPDDVMKVRLSMVLLDLQKDRKLIRPRFR